MTELTQKVLQLLQENEIEKSQILEILAVIYREVEYSMWETIKVSPMVFYGLKDMIWYNLEHLPQGGEPTGQSNLRFLGTKYPSFIYSFNDGDYMRVEEVKNLLAELERISANWNKSWRMASIYSNSQNGWQGGDTPSKIVIHEKTVSPTRYMPTVSRTSRILGLDGNPVKRVEEDKVLCVLDDEIGEYGQGPILYQTLARFQETCRNAIRNNKDLRLEFED